jgi:Tol biopolymer transport system component
VVTASFRDGKLGAPQAVGMRTKGRGVGPAWSRDGRRLAYLTQLGTENYGRQSRGVAVWAPETRQETLLVPSLAYISSLDWSPDDTQLLAAGSDGRGRSGLFAVDPDTGAVAPLVRIHGGDPSGLEGVWLDRGAIAYISADRSKLVRFEPESRTEAVLFEAAAGEQLRRLAADPTAAQIAFGVGSEHEIRELRVVARDGGEPRRAMRADSGSISAVEWAGDALYVTTVQSSRAVVWRVSAPGAAPQETSLHVGGGGIRVSPDGAQAAYVESDQRSEVWSLEGWLPKYIDSKVR